MMIPGSAIPSLTIGGVVFVDLTNLIVLFGRTLNQANSGFIKQYGPGTIGTQSVGYTVTAGKTLTIRAAKINATTSNTNVELCYGDVALGLDVATAVTNPVYYGTGTSTLVILQYVPNSAVTFYSAPGMEIFWQIPSAKCPTMTPGAASCQYFIYGYEA